MAGKKILIVEDEVVQLTALARRLKSAGFEVVAARDEQPDLIVLDLGIPAGDGFVVLQRLSMLINTGTIPVIVLTSRTPIGNRDAARKAGAVAYIHKPVDVPVLLKAIDDALGIPSTDALPQPPPPPPQS
jgi:DNA-binding response OmpR family regulator